MFGNLKGRSKESTAWDSKLSEAIKPNHEIGKSTSSPTKKGPATPTNDESTRHKLYKALKKG